MVCVRRTAYVYTGIFLGMLFHEYEYPTFGKSIYGDGNENCSVKLNVPGGKFAISVSKREELTYDEIKELMTHEGNKFSFKNSFL